MGDQLLGEKESMTLRVPVHRGILISVFAMILAIMLMIFIAAQSFGNANTLLLLTILLIPIFAISISIATISPGVRSTGYLAIAVTSFPIAVLGLPGGWGLLFAIGILFLVWGAWFERWGKANDGV